MNALFRPGWLLVAVTLPQSVLAAAWAGTWALVGSQLAERGVRSWILLGGFLALLLGGFTGLALRAMLARRALPRPLGPALLVTHIPFLWVVVLRTGELVPPRFPREMLFDGDPLVAAFTLAMPALIYALFLTVGWLTPDERTASPWKSLAGAGAVPLGWYLAWTAGAAALKGRPAEAALTVLGVLSTVIFLFFVVRAAHIALAGRSDALGRLRLLWVAVVAVVLPQLGLALNEGLIFAKSLPRSPFGDFGHPAFHALAAVNGALLCLPRPCGAGPRFALAVGRALLLPFTGYFFLVFLPFFPLSVFAIAAFGAGFLMLTPLLLMHVHARALREDFADVRRSAGTAGAAALAGAALVLPVLVVAGCLRDRAVLHRTLDYVRAPDYAAAGPPPIAARPLRRVLSHVSFHKEGPRRSLLGERLPYLSPLYQYVVLGRLTLSDGAISELEAVFFGACSAKPSAARPFPGLPGRVEISRLAATSTPDADAGALRASVALDITNTGASTDEFATSFALPEGAWISEFHLRIGDRDEPAVLADSRAAAWVYRRIVSTQQDPGILYRQANGRYAIRVFPVAAGETRRLGFTMLHREPFSLTLGGRQLRVGEGIEAAAEPAVVRVGSGEVHWVPAALKRRLPTVTRRPVAHFVVDCSAAAAPRREDFVRRIARLLDQAPFPASAVRFTLVDAGQTSFAGDGDWQRRVREHEGAGGFFLGLGVKSILRSHYEERSDTFPVLIVVTDAMPSAVVPDGLSGFSFTSPEGALLRVLGPDGAVTAFGFDDADTPVGGRELPWTASPVLAYPSRERPLAFLPDDGRDSVVIAGRALFAAGPPAGSGSWERGLALEGLSRALQLDPAGRKRKELALVRESFAAGILGRATSFIAVENQAQQRALREMQRRTLAAHPGLDVDEASFEQMSEPGWLVLAALAGLAMIVRNRRRTSP